MAVDRVLLCAHERHTIVACFLDYTVQTALEQDGASQSPVLNPAVLVTRRILRPRAQFPPNENVPNTVLLQGVRNRLPIELRVETAVRRRTDVGDRGDAVLLQHDYEVANRVRRVPYRQDRVTHVWHSERLTIAAMSL